MKRKQKNQHLQAYLLGLLFFVLLSSVVFLPKQSYAVSGDYSKPINGTLAASEWNNLINDFVAKSGSRLDGYFSINTATSSTYALDIDGALRATSITGSYTGFLNAANISSGQFGSNAGYGNFSFPGNVGIGTTSPLTKLNIVGSGTTSATVSLLIQNGTGAEKMKVLDSGQALFNGTVLTSLPQIGFLSDTNTGLNWVTTDTVGLMAGGITRFSCSSGACGAAVPTTLTRLTTTLDVNIGTTLSAGRIGTASLNIGGNPESSSLAALEVYGGISAYSAPSGAVVFYDTFSGGVTEELSVHSPDTGTSWTRIIQNGSATASSRNTGFAGPTATLADQGVLYTADGSYPTADYEVSAYMHALDSSDDVLILAVRVQDSNNMYVARLSSSATGIYKMVGGTWTLVGSSAVYLVPGTYVKFRVIGNVLSLYRGDSLLLTVSDSSISSAGKAGLGFGRVGIITSDDHDATWQIDNFSVKLYESSSLAALFMNGNVGIGTTNPISTLDVDGLIKMRTALITADEDVVNKGYLDSALASSTGGIITMVASSSFWQGNMAGNIYNANTGNIGIGNNNPGAQLDITYSGTTPLNINRSGVPASDGYFRIINYTSSAGVFAPIFSGKSNNDGFPGFALMGESTVDTGNKALVSVIARANNGLVANRPLFSVANFDPFVDSNIKFLINSAGNIGVGTTNPTEKLDISSTAAGGSTLRLYVDLGTYGDRGIIKFNGRTGGGGNANTAMAQIVGGHTDTGTTNYLDFKVGAWNNNNTIGSTMMRINSSGNVGIGTTTPGTRLTVVGSGNYSIDAGNFRVGNVATPVSALDAVNKSYFDSAVSAAQTAFWNLSGSNLFASSTSWNVGIGITNPGDKLTVNGDIRAHSNLYVAGPTDSQRFIHLRYNSVSWPDYSSYIAQTGAANIAGTAGLIINTNIGNYSSNYGINFAIASSSKMFIQHTGNVGIGTVNPTAKLYVNGTSIFNDVATFTQPVIVGAPVLSAHAATKNYVDSQISSSTGAIAFWGGSTGSNIWSLNSGNVGVGTTTPAAKLHLVTSPGSNVLRVAGNNPAYYMDLVPYVIGGGNYGYIFKPYGAAGYANGLVIDTAGNVGIGTTNPTGKLHVNLGAGSVTNSVLIDNTSASGYSSVTLRDNRLSSSYVGQWGLYGNGVASPNTSNMFFYNTAGGGIGFYVGSGIPTNDLRMLISSSGNVGIGTTTPGTRLTVVGSGNYSIDAGNYRVGNVATPVSALDAVNKSYFDSAVSASQTAFWNLNGSNLYASSTSWNVGIGTTSPINKFSIHKDITSNGLNGDYQLTIRGASDYRKMIGIGYDTTSNFAYISSGIQGSVYSPIALQVSGGNVGIGTTSPTTKLEVVPNAGAPYVGFKVGYPGSTSGVFMGRVSGFGGLYSYIGDSYYYNSNSWRTPSNVGSAIRFNDVGGISLFTDSGLTANTNYIPTERMVILANGNVGIGTTTPGTRLTVVGSGNYSIDAGNYRIGNVATPVSNLDAVNKAYLDSAVSTSQTAFWNLSGSNLFASSTSWNVGIGTTNPGAKLEVVGSVLLPAAATIQFGTAWNTGALDFKNGATTAVRIDVPNNRMVNNLGKYLTQSSSVSQFGTLDNYATTFITNNAERVRIDTAGNIGIGTTNPNAKLHIQGAIKSQNIVTSSPDSNLRRIINVASYQGGRTDRTGILTIKLPSPLPHSMGKIKISGWSYGKAWDIVVSGYMRPDGAGWTSVGGSTVAGNPPFNISDVRLVADNTNDIFYILLGAASTNYGYYASVSVDVESIYSDNLPATGWDIYISASDPVFDTSVTPTIALYGSQNTFVPGNVGIGTTTPGTRLTVVGSGNYSIDAGNYRVGNVATPVSNLDAVNKAYLDSAVSTSQTAFWNLSGSNLFASSTSWNVGIGTTNPGVNLEIDSDANTFGYGDGIRIYGHQNSASYRSVIGFYRSRGTKAIPTATQVNDVIGSFSFFGRDTSSYKTTATIRSVQSGAFGAVGNGNLEFWTADGTTESSKMTILGNGNVGIGTTTPGTKLDVNGVVRASDYYVTGNSSENIGGVTVQRKWKKSVTVGNIQELGSWNDTEGDIQLLVAVSSETGSNSGTNLYLIQGGFNKYNSSWSEVVPYSEGLGHGEFPGGTKLMVRRSDAGYTYNIGVAVPSGASKNLQVTVTELKGGMTFIDLGGTAPVAYSSAATFYSHNSLFVGGNVGIGTTTPGTRLTVVGSGNYSIDAGNYRIGNVATPVSNLDAVNKAYLDSAVSTSQTAFWNLSGSNLFASSTSWNVGIGTTNPAVKFVLQHGGANYTPLWTSPTADMAFGVKTNTSMITGMDFYNENSAGQVRLMARNDANNYIAMNAMGTTASASFFGQAGNQLLLFGVGKRLAIGTNTADPLIFGTSNTERIRIDSSGNVGIGITNPTARLYVNGTSIFNDVATFTQPVIVGAPVLSAHAATKNYVDSQVSSSTGAIAFWGGAVGSNIWSLNSGNVGIGTTNPLATLDILHPNSASGGIRLQSSLDDLTLKRGRIKTGHYNNSEEPVTLLITSNSSGDNLIAFGGSSTVENSANTIAFYTGETTTTLNGTERMRINSSGNLGVGTASPNSRLHVYNTAANAEIDIQSLVGAGNHWGMYSNLSDNSYRIWGGSDYLTILRGGNVGIGTTNPGAYRLNVNGNTNITGNLNVTGTTTATAFVGPVVGTLNAANVSAGAFGANTGGGNYSFPGNVGIGTSSPAQKLEVYGGIAISPSNRLGSGGATWAGASGQGNGYLELYNGSSGNTTLWNSANFSMIFGINNAEVMRLRSGNVGIGTTNPIFKLDVDASSIGARINGTYGSLQVGNPAVGSELVYGAQSMAVNSNNLYLKTNSLVRLFIANAGNVGIGTTDPGVYRLKVAGDMAITGTLQTQTGSDFAEEFSVTEDLSAGTVVVMSDEGHKSVKAAASAYDRTVVGIVSDNPSIIAGKVDSEKKVVVAMMGVVSVKASDSNGRIRRGDLLTSADLDGYAMKASEFKPGTIIGKALEDLKGSSGQIKVLVNLQ